MRSEIFYIFTYRHLHFLSSSSFSLSLLALKLICHECDGISHQVRITRYNITSHKSIESSSSNNWQEKQSLKYDLFRYYKGKKKTQKIYSSTPVLKNGSQSLDFSTIGGFVIKKGYSTIGRWLSCFDMDLSSVKYAMTRGNQLAINIELKPFIIVCIKKFIL